MPLILSVPLAIWTAGMDVEEAKQTIVKYISLTYANETVLVACTAYSLAIGYLIKHSND